jgi:DNA-3-methyladenine glycosylase
VTPSPSASLPGASRREPAHGPEGPGTATPWVWRSCPVPEPGPRLPDSFFLRDASAVARDLLGTCLRSTVGGIRVEGVVVETEAYLGPEDPASHAARRIGRTSRNETMYGPPGRAYVYRSYGIHWCLNVVTGEEGFPAAVLLRGLDPIRGIEWVRMRRGGKEPLCAGPGRLGQGLGVTGALDGHPLVAPPLELLRGWQVRDEVVAVSGRIGVGKAANWPLRFYLLDHPQVSPGPRRMAQFPRDN